MRDPEVYRRKAAECDVLARQNPDQRLGEHYRMLAQVYRDLAASIEQIAFRIA